MAVCHGVEAIAKVDWGHGDAILAIVDTTAIRQDVNVCAFGAELAVALCVYMESVSITAVVRGRTRRVSDLRGSLDGRTIE